MGRCTASWHRGYNPHANPLRAFSTPELCGASGPGVGNPRLSSCVPSARGVHGELGPPKMDAILDHEPGCKGFELFNREWTPMDANKGQ